MPLVQFAVRDDTVAWGVYALRLSVFTRVLAGELVKRQGHVVLDDQVALWQSQRNARMHRQAHAQRTRSFIISFAVRQTLHRRIRFGEYLGSSMVAAWCIVRRVSGRGGRCRKPSMVLSRQRKCPGAFKIALGMQMTLRTPAA
jgi:hypothetical protein